MRPARGWSLVDLHEAADFGSRGLEAEFFESGFGFDWDFGFLRFWRRDFGLRGGWLGFDWCFGLGLGLDGAAVF